MSGWGNGNHFLYAMISDGQNLFGTGDFARPVTGVGRWDGTNWHAMGSRIFVGAKAGLFVAALAFRGNELFAGGQLDNGFSTGLNGIARFDGTDWVNVAGGVTVEQAFPGTVYAMTPRDGALFVGGFFDRAGSVLASNIARWDGTNWSAVGAGMPWEIYQLAFKGETLYATSPFGLHRWDGSNWLTEAIVSGGINTLAVNGGDIYVGGLFNSITNLVANSGNSVLATNIARWDGTNWWPLGSGIRGHRIYDIEIWNNQVVVCGSFHTAGGKTSTNLAVWHWPAVDIAHASNQIEVSWWKGFTNYALECSTELAGTNWSPVTVASGTNYHATAASGTNKFFRLRQE